LEAFLFPLFAEDLPKNLKLAEFKLKKN